MDDVLQQIYDNIINGNELTVSEYVQKALIDGTPPENILNKAMISAMSEVGRRFEQKEFYVPEMLLAAHAMQKGLAILKPVLRQANIKAAGKIVIGTVEGDMHDIGKNLVAMMLEGAGFELIDLGVDVAPSRFLEAIREYIPDVLGLSALLTTSMPKMKKTIEILEEEGLRPMVKVMIGGAPVTDEYARQIGADGYAADASRAVTMATKMIGAK